MHDAWLPDFYTYNPLFDDITELAQSFRHFDNWPQLIDYNLLRNNFTGNLQSLSGAELLFVEQDKKTASLEQAYESRIYLKGEIQTRLSNWHDFFQVLIWTLYPETKKIINKIHYRHLSERMASSEYSNRRTPAENTLTIFDECGAIIVSSNPDLLELISKFSWKELFLENRDSFNSEIKCFVFGHALLEKGLKPYLGMTAHSLLFKVSQEFFNQEKSAQMCEVDKLGVNFFHECPEITTGILNPFPVLGIPGWDDSNKDAGYYENRDYFRNQRKK